MINDKKIVMNYSDNLKPYSLMIVRASLKYILLVNVF